MEDKPDTRRTILETSLELFALQGYDATGTQQIVDNSGYSKPTLYHYFGNKRGLLDAIIGEYGAKMVRMVEQGSAYNHDLVMNLKILTQEMIAFAFAHQNFYRFYTSLLSSAPDNETYRACTSLKEAINEDIERLFARASDDHGNMRGREKAYSESFQGLMRTWAMLVINKEVELTDNTLHSIVHQFMHGIFS